jgi:hypothetical protein
MEKSLRWVCVFQQDLIKFSHVENESTRSIGHERCDHLALIYQ